MASRELRFGRRVHLDICDGLDHDCYTQYRAIVNQKEIMETARVLNSLGGELLRDRTTSSPKVVEGYFDAAGYSGNGSGLQSVVSTVDTLLKWLEQSGNLVMKDLKKREAVLRGVVRLTELGSQSSLFRMLEIACEFLDVPDDPYPAQRQFIMDVLAETETQKQRIFRVTEKASDMLQAMIDAESLDISKAMQFDNVLREAGQEIEACARRLTEAKEKIVELTQKMQAVKWFSRCVRAMGLGIFCFFFYYKYMHESSIGVSLMFTGFCASGVLFLSLFPRRAYAFADELSKLDAKHRLLAEGLNNVHERLSSSSDYRDKVIHERTDTVTSDK